MTLSQIVSTKKPVAFGDMPNGSALAKETQTRLIALGCLDPPADGKFGTISQLALGRFADQLRLSVHQQLTPAVADALLKQTPATFIPLKLGSDFASRIVKYMQLKKYFVAKLPGFLNIVYVEGADATGQPNADEFDKWNDRRIILRIDGAGRPVLDFNALCTTEPGRFFTLHPLNSLGAARISFDQFRQAWQVGFHHPNDAPPSRHEALVQVGEIKVHRDLNKDGKRTGDKVTVGMSMGINQHSGHNQSTDSIGKMSAGCLVARSDVKHKEFMRQVKKDPRFIAKSGYRFMSTIIAGDDLKNQVP